MQHALNVAALLSVASAQGDNNLSRISVRTGLARSVLTRAAKGENRPSMQTVRRLATTYGVSIDDLVVWPDETVGELVS
jgi:DNA-binding phage protein